MFEAVIKVRWRARTLGVGAALTAIVSGGAIGGSTTAGSIGAATPSGASIEVEADAGPPGTPLVVRGTGCETLVWPRIDDAPIFPPIFLGGDGWTFTTTFPAALGPHTLEVACAPQSTAGAPTTMLGPGEVEFAYDPITITTTDERPVAPQGPAVEPASPASPALGSPGYTG